MAVTHSKVIEEFVGKQLRLLKQEARAEQFKLKQEGSNIQAEAVSSSYDDNLGWIIGFTCSFQILQIHVAISEWTTYCYAS